MEYKFDPRAKVKQGDLSESTLGTKKPMETTNIKVSYSKEERATETQDGKFDYQEPKKFKSQIDANFNKLADKKDY